MCSLLAHLENIFALLRLYNSSDLKADFVALLCCDIITGCTIYYSSTCLASSKHRHGKNSCTGINDQEKTNAM